MVCVCVLNQVTLVCVCVCVCVCMRCVCVRARGVCVCVESGHSASVNAVSFSCDGAYVASGSGSSWEHDNTVRIWNVLERNQQEELVGHEAAVSSVHFAAHPRPHLLASASHDHSIRLWDTRNHLDQSHLLATLQQGGMVHCVRWSPCASMLAAASSGLVRLMTCFSSAQMLTALG